MMGSSIVPLPFLDPDASRAMEGTIPTDDDGDPHLRSLFAIKGTDILATDGEIGHVENLLIDDAAWAIRYLIVDTSNWWFGQHVLIAPFSVQSISWFDQVITVTLSRAQVKASPAWDPLAVIDQAYQQRLHSHYDWPGYGW